MSTRIVNPLAEFVCKAWARGALSRERFSIERNHSIEKESLKIKGLEKVLGEKIYHLFEGAALSAVRNGGPLELKP